MQSLDAHSGLLFEVSAPPAPPPATRTIAVAPKGPARREKLPAHLPREIEILDLPQDRKPCPRCGRERHAIGEMVSEKRDYVPATLKVLQTRRPKYACRACDGEIAVAPPPAFPIEQGMWKLVDAWPYGDVYVLQALWEHLGIAQIIKEQAGQRRLGFAVERALFAMVANRCCAPASKLYCFEQWLREDVRIEGCEALELQHLYRAMGFLEANKEAIERAIFFRVADLLNLDVDIVF